MPIFIFFHPPPPLAAFPLDWRVPMGAEHRESRIERYLGMGLPNLTLLLIRAVPPQYMVYGPSRVAGPAPVAAPAAVSAG